MTLSSGLGIGSAPAGSERVTHDVLLGPVIDLHTGIHGAMRDAPPPSIAYRLCDAEHVFVWPADAPPSPFHGPAVAELIDCGIGQEPVHSPRWPVLNRRGWLIDLDDFGFPIFFGRYAVNPLCGTRDSRRESRSADTERALHHRIENMLTAYAHRSCVTVMCNTVAERARLDTIIDSRPAPERFDGLRAKTRVLYPAVAPIDADIVRRKWSGPSRLRVIFCGRDYSAKNGDLALRVLARTAAAADIDVTLICDVPESARAGLPLGDRFRITGSLSRDEVLRHMADAHILFHTSESESLGMVFLEAAASGMAIVVATGGQMAHTREWFADGGAVLVDLDTIGGAERESAFETALRRLALSWPSARAYAEQAYEIATHGTLSLSRRNDILERAYAAAIEARHVAEPLTIADLPYPGSGATTRLRSQALMDAERAFRAAAGVDAKTFRLSIDI